MAPTERRRLVILGSGWGGYQVLRKIDKTKWDVTIISPSQYFAFTPLLAGCAVGTLEFRCTLEPVRRFARGMTSYQAWCDKIDFERKTLLCTPETPAPVFGDVKVESISQHKLGKSFEIQYDKLVIAVGAYSQTFGIPGVKEHAHFLKNPRDARDIRSRIVECFEQASQPTLTDTERRQLLHFCVVGGGPTGVEFAAELHDLLYSDAVRHYPDLADKAQITLYDVAPHILSSFDESLVKYAESKFRRDGIIIKNQHHVESVSRGSMRIKEEGDVPFGMLVWSTGLAPNPLVESISVVKKEKKSGALFTNDSLNVMRTDGSVDPDVWAIGDAAIVEGNVLPATAQVANQKGLYLVKELNRMGRSRPPGGPFKFRDLGSLAYLGDRRALYDRSKTDQGWQTKEAGRFAWVLWRSAYMTMTLSWRNKITVPFYWMLNSKLPYHFHLTI